MVAGLLRRRAVDRNQISEPRSHLAEPREATRAHNGPREGGNLSGNGRELGAAVKYSYAAHQCCSRQRHDLRSCEPLWCLQEAQRARDRPAETARNHSENDVSGIEFETQWCLQAMPLQMTLDPNAG